MPGHVLDACFVEDLQAAGLLAASCTNLQRPVVGGFAASADTELASRMAELVRYGVRVRHLTSLELPQHESMLAHYRALSVADAEALVIARAAAGDGIVADRDSASVISGNALRWAFSARRRSRSAPGPHGAA